MTNILIFALGMLQFFLIYWYIAFIPSFISLAFALWQYNFRPLIYGFAISIIVSFFGTLFLLQKCFICLFPGFTIM